MCRRAKPNDTGDLNRRTCAERPGKHEGAAPWPGSGHKLRPSPISRLPSGSIANRAALSAIRPFNPSNASENKKMKLGE
jgi:hypothetical protein